MVNARIRHGILLARCALSLAYLGAAGVDVCWATPAVSAVFTSASFLCVAWLPQRRGLWGLGAPISPY